MLNSQIIQKELINIGLNTNNKGFLYLATAIELYYSEIKIIELYDRIGEMHNTTGVRVERCMRHSISMLLKNNSIVFTETMKNKYGVDLSVYSKMTNSNFISLMKLSMSNLYNKVA